MSVASDAVYEEYGAVERVRRPSCLLYLAPLGFVGLLSVGALVHSQRAVVGSSPVALVGAQPSVTACAAGVLPHKHALSHVTPVELQMERGGCWMFAAVSLLEHSYRQHGLAKGWLQEGQYLKLSEQAFGVAVLGACRDARAAGLHTCVFDGDRIYTGNSTEGGEVPVVYYLSRALASTAALPWSTCPYTPAKGHDRECAGLDDALRVSPLSFNVRGMRTYYERVDAKRALVERGKMLALSMPMANVRYLLPCTERNARNPVQCGPDLRKSVVSPDNQKRAAVCEPCPLERAFVGVECCVASDREMHTMGGEFFFLPDLSLQLEGGHAVNIVGFTDTFQTEHGHTGGWIVKNSWWDGLPPNEQFWNHARGSHSIDYFMQRISDNDEGALCPNSHSPRSWHPSGLQKRPPQMYPCADLKTCRDAQTAMYARAAKRVLRLQCLNRSPFVKDACRPGDKYFLKHLEPLGGGLSFGGGLTQACLVYDDPNVDTSGEQPTESGVTRRRMPQERIDPVTNGGDLCTPPLPVDDLAMLFGPVEEEDKPNDPDHCGFYLMPYAVLDMLGRRFGGWFATELDVEWSDASYADAGAARGARFSAASYDFLSKDIRQQRRASFDGSPFPTILKPL